MRYSLGLLSAAVVFTVFVGAPAHMHGQAPAAQAQDPHDHDHAAAAEATPATTPEQRQGMMNMMADMQAADKKLDALVQTMNASKGAEKTDAMAALLTALVKEHTSMRSSMMNMMGMMGNMPGMMGAAPDKARP